MPVSLRTALGSCVGSLFLCQAALAGFSLVVDRADAGSRDVLSIRAINDGVGGSGTDVHSYEISLNVVGVPNAKAYFAVKDTNANSVPDTVDLTNASNLAGTGFFRVGSAANTSFVVVETTPAKTLNFAEPNPWLSGVANIHVVATNAGSTALATGSGALIAQIYVDDAAGISGLGTLGGESGPAFRNIPISVAPVPEPTTLIAGAATGLLLSLRRR